MKKLIILCFVLILSAKVSYCLDPLRVSVSTTPELTADLTIDLLDYDGTLISNVYSESDKSSGASGIISVILQGGAWGTSGYSKDYLVKITYGTTVLSIERLEVAITKQSLYGATISTDDIDQTNQLSFKSLSLSGDLDVAGKTTLKKTVGNVKNITLTSNSTTIDLSDALNSTLVLNITSNNDATQDIINLTNPSSGQILIIHFTSSSESMTINSAHTIGPNNMRFLVYINSKWHPFTFATEF